MSTENSQIDSLERRLREVETTTTTLTGTIGNVGADVSELKQMFQSFIAESNKIAELGARVQAAEKVDQKCDILFKKYDAISQDFNALKAEHNLCQASRGKSEDYLKDLGDRLLKIESGKLTEIEIALRELKESKQKAENVVWRWVDKIAWLFVLATLFVLLQHNTSVERAIKAGGGMIKPGSSIEHTHDSQVNGS